MLRKTLIAAGAAALLLPVAATAQTSRYVGYDELSLGDREGLMVTGENAGDLRIRAVRVGDLDLRADRDVRVADARLRNAAAKVCGVGRMNGSVIPEQGSQCFRDAFGKARVALNTLISEQRMS